MREGMALDNTTDFANHDPLIGIQRGDHCAEIECHAAHRSWQPFKQAGRTMEVGSPCLALPVEDYFLLCATGMVT
jgi:hypothetical protein